MNDTETHVSLSRRSESVTLNTNVSFRQAQLHAEYVTLGTAIISVVHHMLR